MITSQTANAWTSDPSLLSRKQVGYYRARLRNRVHQFVLAQYDASGLSRAELARRIYKRPEQITRLLGAPGNWTLDTVSDLLLAMGYEPAIAISSLKEATGPTATAKQEVSNAPFSQPKAGTPAANDELQKHKFETFDIRADPGSTAQPPISAIA